MNAFRALVPLGLVLALGLAAFPAAAAAAPASVPTWQVGQAVGYGTTVNLTSLFDAYVRPTLEGNTSSLHITAINALDFTGSLDTWTYDQVTQQTSTYYVLSSRSATGLRFHLYANLTMNNLSVPGTYTGTPSGYGFCIPPTIPETTRTLAVTLDGTILTETQSAIHQRVSDLAYINETSAVTTHASVAASTYNVPTTSTNSTTCVETVTYGSPHFTLTVDTQDQLRLLFQPALDYFNFPIADNETWWANTTATVGATLSGTINVVGLSSKDQAAFFADLKTTFQSAGLAVSGLSAFPIDLAKVTISAGLTNIVRNGVVTDIPLPLDESLRAIASAKSLSDGSVHPVYLITSARYECPSSGNLSSLPVGYAAVYAPDFPAPGAGMIVGYELLACLGSTNVPGYELTNTKPADAQQKIGQTESTYEPFPSAATNTFADFFVKSPYWGVLLIVAVVVVVGALLVMRRRRRPAIAPPPPPPPGAP